MKIIYLQLIIVIAVLISAFTVPYLSEGGIIFLCVLPMVVCILCGWILIFQAKAVRKAENWIESLFFRSLVPVPSNWVKPVPLSWAGQLLLIMASISSGAIIRMLWIIYT